ncbi:MAG: LysR family transcriptional regulator [Ilumatobacteraceae bacterium]|nr:LysR family transcriptional regulator [Ilumatobacteraceae bacterium]
MAVGTAPNIERLRLLHAVATHGTIAGAARANDYTPSAVSQQISTLEREVGVALVERSNRGVMLTPAGRLLSERTAVILDLLRSAVDDVAQVASGAPATVRIGAFPTAITSIVVPAMIRLASTVRLHVVDLEPEHALAALTARDIDAAVVDRFDDAPAPTSGRLDHATLLVEPIRLVHTTRRRPSSVASCATVPWVLGGVDSRLGRATRAICAAAGFEPDVIVESDDHRVTFDVITATNAVTLLPALAVVDLPRGLAASARVDVARVRHIDFVTRHLPRPDTALAQVEAALRATAARLR